MLPHTKKDQVRVRFAPSPTGFLHIGGIRTALYNFLFARKHGGKFILRIEDTDMERSKKEYETDIIKSMEWMGLSWDEGIIVEGPYGPYRESERLSIYKKYITILLKKNLAYKCFCTKEELDALKQDQVSRGEQPRYTGRCAHLSTQTIEKNLKEKKEFVIRFRTPAKKVVFEDDIRGKVNFDTSIFGDIVIAKTETEPLYNLAVTVDDYAMHITHVIRGEEHLSNTPKQILLQEALEFPHPHYAHLPLILAPDKSKLSKRYGAISVIEYKKQGYLPEALINFLALLGWNPGTDQEFFTLNELIDAFNLKRVQKSGAIFSSNKLKWFNAHYIQKKSVAELTKLCVPFLEKANIIKKEGIQYRNNITQELLTKQVLEKMILVAKERMKTLQDIVELSKLFFVDIPSYDAALLIWKKTSTSKIKENLKIMRDYITSIPTEKLQHPHIEPLLKEKAKTLGVGESLWPLRVALSGLEASPGPHEIIDILGKEKTLKRLDHAIQKL